jgi:hypothetical protein
MKVIEPQTPQWFRVIVTLAHRPSADLAAHCFQGAKGEGLVRGQHVWGCHLMNLMKLMNQETVYVTFYDVTRPLHDGTARLRQLSRTSRTAQLNSTTWGRLENVWRTHSVRDSAKCKGLVNVWPKQNMKSRGNCSKTQSTRFWKKCQQYTV